MNECIEKFVAFSWAISCTVFVVDYFAANFHYVQIIGVQFTVAESSFSGYQFTKLELKL